MTNPIIPDILQTKFLKRYITGDAIPVPVAGPFASCSVDARWFQIQDEDTMALTITPLGILAFWAGVKKHGAKKIMGKPNMPCNPTTQPPTGGTPIAVAA